ncbi:MAG: glycerol-3-phosphate 1-O-acyltransferase PlsY [Acidimicrobiia bacterium]
MGALVAAGAYLLGSVDFAVVIAKARGVDIYSEGSGNPGASNVFRSIGKRAGVAVLVLDLCKGLAATLVGVVVGGAALGAAAGFAAVAGHCYPVFHRFRGGKGAATLAGLLFGLYPLSAAVLLAVFVLVVALTRIASVGTILVALAAIPGAVLQGARGWVLVWLGAGVALVVYRHHGNIGRLFKGTERKVVGG